MVAFILSRFLACDLLDDYTSKTVKFPPKKNGDPVNVSSEDTYPCKIHSLRMPKNIDFALPYNRAKGTDDRKSSAEHGES